MLQRLAIAFSVVSLIAMSATAGSNWESTGFTIAPKDVQSVIDATDKFMATETGKAMPGTLSFMARTVDGADPATHSFLSSVDSIAEREKWTSTLQGNADWTALVDAVSEVSQIQATYRLGFDKNWGDTGDDDTHWELHLISVKNPAKYVEALDVLMASSASEKFPGSLWLSSVMAGGNNPVSHVVSVGYASAAEAEAWNDPLVKTQAWADFLAATEKVSEFRGTILMRTLKTWGTP